jgi:hypothetical protein
VDNLQQSVQLTTKWTTYNKVDNLQQSGQLTTAICCCNAAGSFIPPFLIFARKHMQERLLDGCQVSCTDNGWINGETFLQWLQFFVEQVRPTPASKVLLVLDNHESHKYIKVLDYATGNNVLFLSFVPHTTHKMQPLDISVYGTLKQCFEQAICVIQTNHACRTVNQNDVRKLFASAFFRVAIPLNAISGFQSSGIWPYNPNVFSVADYAPPSVTDRPYPDFTQASPADLPDSEISQTYADNVPLSKTETNAFE